MKTINELIIDSFIYNFLPFMILYSSIYYILYNNRKNNKYYKYKFNKEFIDDKLLYKEIFRSTRSVIIACIYKISINYLYYNTNYLDQVFIVYDNNNKINKFNNDIKDYSFLNYDVLFIIIYSVLFTDIHFYFIHRSLHHKSIYKYIHKIHHESKNPTPFSGLSFHYIESILYFSASLISIIVKLYLSNYFTIIKNLKIPIYTFNIHLLLMIIAPM